MSEPESDTAADASPDALQAAREKFFSGMASLESAAWNAGWDKGWNEGHRAGWDAAFEYIRQRFEEERNAAAHKPPGAPAAKERNPDATKSPEKEPPNAKVAVFNLIQRRPGLRGVELVSALESEGIEMLERTLRTALWRLKNEGKIQSVDGRWYTPESVPPDPLSLLEEEADAAP